MSLTLSSLPGKFKYSLLNLFFFFFCPDGIIPDSSLTGPKAATLNRCQLYYIIKLAELIFSIKVLK